MAICLLTVVNAHAVVSWQQKDRELKQVTQQIQGLKANLAQDKSQRDALMDQLKTIELSISDTANQLEKTNQALAQKNQILDKLHQRAETYQQQLQSQLAVLAQQVRAQYMLGNHEYLKLLLNQENPDSVSRIAKYYQYINQARAKIIQALDATLAKLSQNEKQIQHQTDELHKLYTRQSTEKDKLTTQYAARKAILTQLNAAIKTKSAKLDQLSANKVALEKLIAQLKQQQSEMLQPKIPFAQMRGKLPWPLQGSITKDFSTPIDSSGLTYNGVFISSKPGQPIHAVYPGKVVFANWLRGVGLLVIIEHGHGFMTLYGHEASLNVKVGDYVHSGETLGTAGRSGGVEDSGLYFQIRKNGKPINPKNWCA